MKIFILLALGICLCSFCADIGIILCDVIVCELLLSEKTVPTKEVIITLLQCIMLRCSVVKYLVCGQNALHYVADMKPLQELNTVTQTRRRL